MTRKIGFWTWVIAGAVTGIVSSKPFEYVRLFWQRGAEVRNEQRGK